MPTTSAMQSLMPLGRLAAQRALRSRPVSPLQIRQFTASTTRPAGNTGSGNIISDAGTQQDSSPGSETGGSREHALDKGNKGDPNVQSDASGSARRYVRSQDSSKVQQHYATPFMNLRTGTEGFTRRHGGGDEEVVYERTYADAVRSAKAQDTGGQAVREKDERNATAKAKKEFPEAPDVVIGMQDERGGKAALHDEHGHPETRSVNQGTLPDPAISMPSSTPTTAGLHRLPAELRNLIYELVLFGNDSFPHETNTNFSIFEPPKPSPIPPLTQISRDLRAETLPMWYGNQKLRLASWDSQQAPRFKSWLGVYESHLRYLKLFVLAPCLLHDTTCIWNISSPRGKVSDVAFVFQGTYPPRTLGPAFDAKEQACMDEWVRWMKPMPDRIGESEVTAGMCLEIVEHAEVWAGPWGGCKEARQYKRDAARAAARDARKARKATWNAGEVTTENEDESEVESEDESAEESDDRQ
ncbi:hypothetical protein LTR87_009212 [Friedmanniomyces endolithicus]|nr:hypothetical protein LTR03_014652 [Friedmanniomyces endolithicus]KAK0876974.1 hypothetical protein LTR87_009212 [Friedmanniomyces endolithicus]